MDPRDEIIGLLYEAAISPVLWPKALTAFADAAKSVESTLAVYEKKPDLSPSGAAAILLLISGRLWQQSDGAAYLSHYSSVDPLVKATIQASEGDLRLCQEYVSDREVANSEYYQDLLLPRGGRYIAFWKLEDNTQRSIALALHRRNACFERRDLTHLDAIATHARRAASLSVKMAQSVALGGLFRQALDRQGKACFMVDNEAKVLDCSFVGRELLTCGQVLKLRRENKLTAISQIETKQLHALVAGAAKGRSGGIVRLTNRIKEESFVVEVIPCGVASENPFDSRFSNCALIFVNSASHPQLLDWKKVQIALDCTPAEARVAADLACGCAPVEIAAKRNVSLNTIRTQIRILLARTGLHSIASLVGVLMKFR